MSMNYKKEIAKIKRNIRRLRKQRAKEEERKVQESKEFKISCKNCVFWCQYSDNKNFGECRFGPPKEFYPVTGGFLYFSVDYKSGWPKVRQNYWCGEFKAKK